MKIALMMHKYRMMSSTSYRECLAICVNRSGASQTMRSSIAATRRRSTGAGR